VFVDFSELKQRASIEDVASMLRLNLKPGNNQLRGPCPHCNSGGDRALVITPAKGAFYCFAGHKGGDAIALVAHIRNVSVKDAAQEIAEHVGMTGSQKQVPESEVRQESGKTLTALSYLENEHPAVEAIGFDIEVAKRLGVGYAGKGIMRGTVAVPIRDERGKLLGYIGITEARLPPDFTANVVKFPKTA
jgi:DNA primase